MTDKYREFFNRAVAKAKATGDADKVAKLELCREYFCNPKFRKALENICWEATK